MQAERDSVRLKLEGIEKSFFAVKVLHGVSFDARGGRVLGIVGENGSGKSTTMNVITGVLPRDSGSIFLDGRPFQPLSRRESDAAGIAFIQQELSIFPNLSIAENLFLTRQPRRFSSIPLVSRRVMNERARDYLKMVDLDASPWALAGTLSAGERQLLEVARGLSLDARVFVLDEPTSSLTSREAERLFEIVRRLQRRNVAILYISHNLEDVFKLTDDVVVMRDGRVTLRAATADLQENDLVTAMVGRPIEALFPVRAHVCGRSGPALEVSNISEPGVLQGLNLQVMRGEIVGIAGLMGAGRSEFARVLFGLDPHQQGEVKVNGEVLPSGNLNARLKAGVAFVSEDRRREGLMPNASVADNMSLAALPLFTSKGSGKVRTNALVDAVRTMAERLRLKSGDLRSSPIRTLSGGNQQKVLLGRWMLRSPNVFLLDEPTRGVDVGAKEEIYRLLAEMADAGMAILIISSELEELLGLCDRVLVMRRGEFVAAFNRSEFDRERVLRAAFGQSAAA